MKGKAVASSGVEALAVESREMPVLINPSEGSWRTYVAGGGGAAFPLRTVGLTGL
jgi:hypothetical protein